METKSSEKNIIQQCDNDPIIFCGNPMKFFESERYLGDIIGFSLSESVFLTILKRKGLVMRLISEIKVTIQDYRSSVVGGIIAGFEIWNMAVKPFLYGNCETWTDIPKKALDLLNSIQNTYFSSVFQTPKSTPIPAYYWDSGFLLVENFIIQQKLLFLHHLATLPDQCIAKEIYSIQTGNGNEFPGLVSECRTYLDQLEIDGSDLSIYNKCQWRKLIRFHIHVKNKSDILSRIQSYKKLEYESICNEEYGLKSYLKSMTLLESRTFFAARSHMLRTVQMNYKHNPEYLANSHKCLCGEDDHQSHLVLCPSYSHLREGLDLAGSDKDLVLYYQRVISEREEKENREERG